MNDSSKLIAAYDVGFHISKQKTLPATIAAIKDYSKPYQIFLGAPQSTKMSISDAELEKTAQLVRDTGAQIYIHSQYIINLAQPMTGKTTALAGGAGAAAAADPLEKSSPGELTGAATAAATATPLPGSAWHTSLLIKNVCYGVAMGARGVVVHVGKSVGMPLKVALENMRENLSRALLHATAACPILLETPAGQGTETLTDPADFIAFVESFADVRLRACVDTCHVFVCGYDPVEYIEMFVGRDASEERRDLLRLIHFNDSAVAKGTRKDRHAFVGTGAIGLTGMGEIAGCCFDNGLPMVIE